jgi:hypothetical protein
VIRFFYGNGSEAMFLRSCLQKSHSAFAALTVQLLSDDDFFPTALGTFAKGFGRLVRMLLGTSQFWIEGLGWPSLAPREGPCKTSGSG